MNDMTTVKKQLVSAMELHNETPKDLEAVFYQDYSTDIYEFNEEVIQCSFEELPDTEYDCGYGWVGGVPILAFSPTRVYFRVEYDGAEYIDSVPRFPINIVDVPIMGGGGH